MDIQAFIKTVITEPTKELIQIYVAQICLEDTV